MMPSNPNVRILLAGNQLLWVKELTVGSGTHLNMFQLVSTGASTRKCGVPHPRQWVPNRPAGVLVACSTAAPHQPCDSFHTPHIHPSSHHAAGHMLASSSFTEESVECILASGSLHFSQLRCNNAQMNMNKPDVLTMPRIFPFVPKSLPRPRTQTGTQLFDMFLYMHIQQPLTLRNPGQWPENLWARPCNPQNLRRPPTNGGCR